MKKKFNWTNYLTIVGIVAVCFIMFTKLIDPIYILCVLGALCLIFGIVGFIQKDKPQPEGTPKQTPEAIAQRSFMQILLGAFIFALGLIEGMHLNLTQKVWNGILIVFIVVVVVWLVLKRRR